MKKALILVALMITFLAVFVSCEYADSDMLSTTEVNAPETTDSVSETIAPPQETTAPPQETTAPPQETTAPPQETTAPPQETTAPPQETTAPPQETTAPPQETTAPPQETTAPPQETTAPPQETTTPVTTTVYLVKYVALEGGYIQGDAVQSVAEGENASLVEAVPLEGYRFVGWNDSITTASRTDENVRQGAEYQAVFEKVYNVNFLCAEPCGRIEGEASQTVTAGNACTSVKAVAKVGYRFLCWSNGSLDEELEYIPAGDETVHAVFVVETMKLPVFSIVTEGGKGINTKEEYVSCVVSVMGADTGDIVCATDGKIKLRGNSTAYLPKSPYKLKFDEKVDLFGNGKAKTWTLIANYMDYSLIRNYLAYSVGSEFEDLNYITSMQFVDVYVNGFYDGVYLICEQVEAGKNRVEIDESYDTADTGYLIEMDGRAPDEGVEGRDYFSIGEGDDLRHYAIKSPDTEDEEFTEEHVAFIKDYFEQCMAALDSGDYEQVQALIDVDSFADSYILNELFHCVDVGFSSFYMYKDVDGKLCSGPLWDYDLSVGNCAYNDQAADVNSLWARNDNIWYAKLFAYDRFTELVTEKLHTYIPVIEQTIEDCINTVVSYSDAFERNFERWELLGKPGVDFIPEDIYEIETWEGQVQYVVDWLEASIENLRTCYPTE